MKQFIIDIFEGYKRRVVSRYFLGNDDVLRFSYYPELQEKLCMVALPCYAGVMIYFILAFNVSIGSRSTNLWLLVTFLSLLQDMFLLEPMKVWVNWILINSHVSDEVRSFTELLSKRSRIILRRTSGLMRDSNALVQHYNPACRVARMYPALPISRLLMSIGDHDIPLQPVRTWLNLSYIYFTSGLVAIALLPEVLQESVLDIIAGGVVDFTALALYEFFSYSSVTASLVFVFVICCVVYYVVDGNHYMMQLWRWVEGRRRKVFPSELLYDPEEEEEEEEEKEGESPDPAVSDESFIRKESHRLGLFAKQQRVQLREGSWRVVQRRVTQWQALRNISQMNRKFKIETPLDLEVIEYAKSIDKASRETAGEEDDEDYVGESSSDSSDSGDGCSDDEVSEDEGNRDDIQDVAFSAFGALKRFVFGDYYEDNSPTHPGDIYFNDEEMPHDKEMEEFGRGRQERRKPQPKVFGLVHEFVKKNFLDSDESDSDDDSVLQEESKPEHNEANVDAASPSSTVAQQEWAQEFRPHRQSPQSNDNEQQEKDDADLAFQETNLSDRLLHSQSLPPVLEEDHEELLEEVPEEHGN